MTIKNDKYMNTGYENVLTERWKPIVIDVEGTEDTHRYEISSLGRVRSYQNTNRAHVIRGSVINGYRSLNLRLPNKKNFNRYIHKLVADAFIEKKSEDMTFVIHVNHDKLDNNYQNLQWATKDQMVEHNRSNPNVMNRVVPRNTKNYKLTESKVRMIKKLLKKDATRQAMIAKQFGITATQVKRIWTGENWKNVMID